MHTSLLTLLYIVTTVVSVVSAASNAGVTPPPAANKNGAALRGAAALDDRVDQTKLASIIVAPEKAQTFIQKSSDGTTRRRLWYYFSRYGANSGCREEGREGWDCGERQECFSEGALICAGNYYRSGSSCDCSGKTSCTSSQYQLNGGSSTANRVCAPCVVCTLGQRVTRSCEGSTNSVCETCAACASGKWRNANLQPAGGCIGSGTRMVSQNQGKWVCNTCRTCPAQQYRTGGCLQDVDTTCSACSPCGSGKFRSGGCSGTTDSVCTTCTACAAGKFKSGGCGGTTDSQCQNCPAGRFAFSTVSSSCDGILVKDVRVKQFDATKKFPIWKDIPAGDMGSEEKAMYAEEAVLSFSMPTSLWTELRVYCSKGVGNDRCDSGDVYTEGDSGGGFYFTCTKATIMQSDRPCQCNGVAGFAASGSHEDCGKWGTSTNNYCLLNDGNCKDPITGGSPVAVAGGRFKAQCNPSASLSDRPLCSADPSSSNRIYVRLPGLSTGGTEYSFKIVPSHSTAGYPPSDPSSRVRSLRIQSQCGCVGSVGNGAPVNPTMVQSWDGNLKGSQWELGFDDASVCDTGIKVYSTSAGGDETTRDVAVQATEQTCRPDFNRRVVSSERQDVPSTAGIGDTMTYCLVSSDKALYNSERACVNSAINWAGRVNGFVKTTSGEAVVNCKVWLEADTWDGWSDVDVLSGIGFKDSVPKISNIGAALPADVNLAQCKARCIDIPTCVAIERTEDSATTSSCRFYGPWSANFREGEGEGSTTSQFAGFNANTYFMAKAGNPKITIHRAMAVTGLEKTSNGQKTNFQINMMTNKISTKTKAFTAKAKMFTGDFQHVITPASTQVNIEHLSDSIAGLQSEFTDESSNSISGKIYFDNTVTGDNPTACGVKKVTVTAHSVEQAGTAISATAANNQITVGSIVGLSVNDQVLFWDPKIASESESQYATRIAACAGEGLVHGIYYKIKTASGSAITLKSLSDVDLDLPGTASCATGKIVEVSKDPLGTPVMTGHVGDEAGKYVLTIPRDTTVMLKADYWNDHAPKTCSNATWLETCHTGQAHTSSPNACGCKHTINLVEGKTLELTLTSDLPDYDFIDTTVQQLKVQAFGGACQYRLGGMRLQVQAESCTLFSHNLLIGNGGIEATKNLPAMPYIVKFDSTTITEERLGVSKGDVTQKLGPAGPMQGQQRAQCEWSDQTVIFEYHPTPVMEVQMPNDMKSCQTRSKQMVLSQGKNYSAVVKVSENYGYAGNDEANPREVCHNRPGSIKIEDSISHRHHSCHPQNPRGSTSCSVPLRVFPQGCTLTACTTSEATIPILTGSPNYVDVAGNFSRPYVATVEGTTITKTFRATILGHTAVGDKFSMKLPSFVPTLILRDPPGSASYSFYEKSTTSSTSISVSTGSSESESGSLAAGFGSGVAMETCAGIGAMVCTETFSLDMEVNAFADFNKEKTTGEDNNQFFENSVAETFTTSQYDYNPGPPATAFLVPTMSMIFSMAKFVEYDRDTCKASVRDDAAWEMAPPNPNSMTWTTRWHIENSELPKLQRNLDIELSKSDVDQEKIKRLRRSIWGWGNVTKMDDDILKKAKKNPVPFTGGQGLGKAEAGLSDDQIGFVGANGEYTYATTSTSSDTSSISFSIDRSDTVGMSMDLEMAVFGVTVTESLSSEKTMTLSMGSTKEVTKEISTTVGFSLGDDSLGDSFDVKVYKDPVYGTPIFETISGESMCPWEPGTVAREKVQISAKTASIKNIPNGEAAVFELTLSNLSPVGECSELIFKTIDETNPFGLRTIVFGKGLDDLIFPCLEYAAKTIRLEIWRGPSMYKYPKITVGLFSKCEFYLRGTNAPIGDEIQLEVSWLESCPSVEWSLTHKDLLESGNPWKITESTDDAPNMKVSVFNPSFYNQKWSDNKVPAGRLDKVLLQYRRPSDATWTNALQILDDGTEAPADFIASEDAYGYSTLTMKGDHLQDGEYVLRVVSMCKASVPANPSLDSYNTPQAKGFVDRSPPVQFGFPEPADQEYWPGDAISITFNEKLDCARPFRFQITMMRADNRDRIPSLIVCEGRTISVELASRTSFDDLLGQKVEVSVVNMHDLMGNRQGSMHTWQFEFAVFDLCMASVDLSRLGFAKSLTDAVIDQDSCGDRRRLLQGGEEKEILVTASGGVQVIANGRSQRQQRGRKLLSDCEMAQVKNVIQTQLAESIGMEPHKLKVLRANVDMTNALIVDIRIAPQCEQIAAGSESTGGNESAVGEATIKKSSHSATEYAVMLSQKLMGANPHVGDVVVEKAGAGGRRRMESTEKSVFKHYKTSSEVSVRVHPSQSDPATIRHSQGLLSDADAAQLEQDRNGGSNTDDDMLHEMYALGVKGDINFIFIISLLSIITFVVILRSMCDCYEKVHENDLRKEQIKEAAKVDPASSEVDAIRNFKPKKAAQAEVAKNRKLAEKKNPKSKKKKLSFKGGVSDSNSLESYKECTASLPIASRWTNVSPASAGVAASKLLAAARKACPGNAKSETYKELVVFVKNILRRKVTKEEAKAVKINGLPSNITADLFKFSRTYLDISPPKR